MLGRECSPRDLHSSRLTSEKSRWTSGKSRWTSGNNLEKLRGSGRVELLRRLVAYRFEVCTQYRLGSAPHRTLDSQAIGRALEQNASTLKRRALCIYIVYFFSGLPGTPLRGIYHNYILAGIRKRPRASQAASSQRYLRTDARIELDAHPRHPRAQGAPSPPNA